MSEDDRQFGRAIRAGGWFGVCTLALVAGCPGPTPIVPDDSELVFRDDFAAAALVSGWTFAGADALKWSLGERSGYLRVYPEPLADNPDDTQDSLMLRPLTGDFILVARMEYQTLEERQVSGLLARGDDGRRVSLGLTKISGLVGSFRGVWMLAERGAGIPEGRTNDPFAGESVYLRLERSGDNFTGSYSTDGVTFVVVGTLSNDLSDAVDVGVGTVKGRQCDPNVCNQSVPADFDFFEIRSATAP